MLLASRRDDAMHAGDEEPVPTERKSWRRKRVTRTRGTRDREPLLPSLVPVDGAALSRALTSEPKHRARRGSPGGCRQHRSSDATIPRRDRGLDRPAETPRRAFKHTHAAPGRDTRYTSEGNGDGGERDVRRFILHQGPRTARGIPCAT